MVRKFQIRANGSAASLARYPFSPAGGMHNFKFNFPETSPAAIATAWVYCCRWFWLLLNPDVLRVMGRRLFIVVAYIYVLPAIITIAYKWT
jgi:hypothetical protein